jgi:mono/diheme cytochrome c family protein
MAEKKGVGHAYNVDFLNVVFAASSIFLFLSVVWMVWDDYDREWKNTQRRFVDLEYQVTQAQLQQATRGVDRSKLQQLEGQRQTAEKNVTANQQKVDELQAKLKEADNKLYRATLDMQYMKATYDQDRYDFESARATNSGNVEKKQQKAQEEAKKFEELELARQKAEAEKAEIQKQLGQYTGEIDDRLEAARGDARRGDASEQAPHRSSRPSATKDYFQKRRRCSTFMAPTIKIQQIILPNVVDDVNFIRVPKMDRCQTCHLAIDKKGYEKYPQPFTTHPKLELYLGGNSPHPDRQSGLHLVPRGHGSVGQLPRRRARAGRREAQGRVGEEVPLGRAASVGLPDGADQDDAGQLRQVSPAERLHPNADVLNVAYATYERAGCYACHKTRGFDTNIRKPGPILTKIDSKLTPDWVKTWIRNPRAVKPTTWMPRFFYNSNNSTPEDAARNEAEINAISAYLFANSEPHDFAVKSPKQGDAKSGEEIVKSIGCLGCHVVGEGKRSEVGPRRTFGQPLENIGNKTTYEWIYNWVRDPKHYSPSTYMPNLRLTDAQVADVATYLSGLKSPGGDAAKANPDQKVTDDVLLDYLKNVMPFEDAKTQLAKWNPQQKQVELGQRAINRYGCFSCHDIKGFEKSQPIGTDLSEEGSKLVTRLDFAFVEGIPHTSKIAWFKAKLHDPRVFDKGRVLQPLEKLRMPNFDLTDEEVERLSTGDHELPARNPAAGGAADADGALRLSDSGAHARPSPELRRLSHHRRRRRRFRQRRAEQGRVAGAADADAGRRARPAGLALRIPARADRHPAVAERPHADLRARRFEPEWRHPLLRRGVEHDRTVPVARGRSHRGHVRRCGPAAVRGVQMSAMPCAGRDSQGPAHLESRARPAHGAGASEPRLDSRLAEEAVGHPAGHSDAGLLARLSEIDVHARSEGFRVASGALDGNAEAQIRAIRDHLMTFRGGPSPKTNGAKTANNNN